MVNSVVVNITEIALGKADVLIADAMTESNDVTLISVPGEYEIAFNKTCENYCPGCIAVYLRPKTKPKTGRVVRPFRLTVANIGPALGCECGFVTSPEMSYCPRCNVEFGESQELLKGD